jgi:hypothetical protein
MVSWLLITSLGEFESLPKPVLSTGRVQLSHASIRLHVSSVDLKLRAI